MGYQIEHANITVRDVEAVIGFLTTAVPGFRVRGANADRSWVHVGTDDTYLALQAATQDGAGPRKPYADPGLNHIGFAVDDLDALKDRLISAGYKEHYKDDSHPFRRRSYFYDGEGNEWEFVQYLSDDPAERNDYSR